MHSRELSDVIEVVGDESGECVVPLQNDEIAVAILERSGYAPTRLQPIFPGYTYCAVLQIGQCAIIKCLNADGEPVPGATLHAYWWDSPNNDNGADYDPICVGQSTTDATGTCKLEYLPEGQFELCASTNDLQMGAASFQLFAALGRELFLSQMEITIQVSPSRELNVALPQELAETPTLFFGAADGLHLAPIRCQRAESSIQIGPVSPNTKPAIWLVDGNGEMWCKQFNAKSPKLEKLRSRESLTVKEEAIKSCDTSPLQSSNILFPVSFGTYGTIVRCAPSANVAVLPHAVADKTVATISINKDTGALAYGKITGAKLEHIQSGSIELQYVVAGQPPHGGYIRVVPVEISPVSNGVRALLTRVIPTDPDGVVRVHGLLPGKYKCEPHFHMSVFSQSLRVAEVIAGEMYSDIITVDRGRLIQGRVQSADDASPIPFGYVSFRSSGNVEHYPVVPVDSRGRFTVSGLLANTEYNLIYTPSPWNGFPAIVPFGSAGPLPKTMLTLTPSDEATTEVVMQIESAGLGCFSSSLGTRKSLK